MLALACTAQFMVVLDVSIVNVALPAIRHSLGFSQAGLQWVLNAYTLTFAGFLLLGGRAADLFGRRRIFLIGLFVFTAASLLGGLAQNQAMLIGARAAQGLGGAILSPATLTILTTTFTEPKARARALGIWSAVAGAGGAAGALLGGILTDELSWRWILFINIPIGIVTLLVARLFLSETRSPSAERSLDLPGAVLVTGGLTALVYGLVRTTSVGWTSWQTIVALLLALVLIGAFLLQEGRLAHAPLMPLRLFAIRSLWSANLVMFMLSGAIFAMWFFVSLYLQLVLGYSALRTGFAFLPQTIAIVVGAQIASRAVLRIGPRPLLLMGTLCSARRSLLAVVRRGAHRVLVRPLRGERPHHPRARPLVHAPRALCDSRRRSLRGGTGERRHQHLPPDRGRRRPRRPRHDRHDTDERHPHGRPERRQGARRAQGRPCQRIHRGVRHQRRRFPRRCGLHLLHPAAPHGDSRRATPGTPARGQEPRSS